MNSIEQKNLKLAFGAALASLSLKLGFFAGAEAPKPKSTKEKLPSCCGFCGRLYE